jgi:hypothetical protein
MESPREKEKKREEMVEKRRDEAKKGEGEPSESSGLATQPHAAKFPRGAKHP